MSNPQITISHLVKVDQQLGKVDGYQILQQEEIPQTHSCPSGYSIKFA